MTRKNRIKSCIFIVVLFICKTTVIKAQLTATDKTDVQVFPNLTDQQSEVHISINKTNQSNIVAASNTQSYGQGYYVSNDGGVTWAGSPNFPCSPIRGFTGDPSTAFDASGNSFMSTMYIASNSFMYFTKSNDNGATWANAVGSYPSVSGLSGLQIDKPMIVADNLPTSTYKNNLYCVYCDNTDFPQTQQQIVFFKELNNLTGSSYAKYLTSSSTTYGDGANVQTGTNGEVYVCWAQYPWPQSGGAAATGIGFVKSTNGGSTFSTETTAFAISGIDINTQAGVDTRFGSTRVNSFPAMAVDKSCGTNSGKIYIVYPNGGGGKSVIQIRSSVDGGATWSAAKTISLSTASQSWFPWIAVDDASGVISVVYYAMDNSTQYSTNTYVAYSADGGATFSNIKVSDISHITAVIPGYGGGDAGDYIGIAAYGGKAFPAWMDNRSGAWQIYISEVTYSAPVLYSSTTNLDVRGPLIIPSTIGAVTYEASNNILMPATNTFASLSGTNLTVVAGNEINFTNGFSTSNEMHGYISSLSVCTNALSRLSALSASTATTSTPLTSTLVFNETKLGSNLKLGMYPNPTSGIVYLNLSAQQMSTLLVKINTLDGTIVLQNSFIINEGANSFKVDLGHLNQGVYFINITDENGVDIKHDKLILMPQ